METVPKYINKISKKIVQPRVEKIHSLNLTIADLTEQVTREKRLKSTLERHLNKFQISDGIIAKDQDSRDNISRSVNLKTPIGISDNPFA